MSPTKISLRSNLALIDNSMLFAGVFCVFLVFESSKSILNAVGLGAGFTFVLWAVRVFYTNLSIHRCKKGRSKFFVLGDESTDFEDDLYLSIYGDSVDAKVMSSRTRNFGIFFRQYVEIEYQKEGEVLHSKQSFDYSWLSWFILGPTVREGESLPVKIGSWGKASNRPFTAQKLSFFVAE